MIDVQTELAVGLAKTRGGQNAGIAASRLLKNDSTSELLAGITSDGEHAIYYDTVLKFIIKVPVPGRDEMDGLAREEIKIEVQYPWFENWLLNNQDMFGWVHPRFQWLIE